MKPTRAVICALVLSMSSGCAALATPVEHEAPLQEAATQPTTRVYERFEVSFTIQPLLRHPDDVTIQARLHTPSGGRSEMGGFAADGGFRVRLTPREPGLHRYVVYADGGLGSQVVASGSFLAVSGAAPGFVHLAPGAPGHLQRDDGVFVYPLGENRFNIYDPTWNHDRLDAPAYIAAMAARGMNALRVFIFTDCDAEDRPGEPQPGCLEPTMGRFDETAAAAYDDIFTAAEAHGVYVILTLFAVGFTPNDTWKSWEDNPYYVGRGGLVRDNWEFFVSAPVRQQAQRRLKYVLDRYGYSPQLLAIDLINEPEWDGHIGEETWIPWAQELADAARAHDPYGHLITVGSVGLHWNVEGDERPWYGDMRNSMVQWHLYGPEVYAVHELAATMTRKVVETRGYGKPVLCGEFGYGGEDPALFDHTHVGIWSATFSGAGVLSHSAPPFTIDSDAPMSPPRGQRFRVLADFLAQLDARAPRLPRFDLRASPAGVQAWSLHTGSSRALWLLGPPRDYGEAVSRAQVALPDMPRGSWQVRWIDDRTGKVLAESTEVALGDTLLLQAPPFRRHVAALITPVPGAHD